MDRTVFRFRPQVRRPPCFSPLLGFKNQDHIWMFRRVTERKPSSKTSPPILCLAFGLLGREIQAPHPSMRFQNPPKWQNKMLFLPFLLCGTLISVFLPRTSKMSPFLLVIYTLPTSLAANPLLSLAPVHPQSLSPSVHQASAPTTSPST